MTNKQRISNEVRRISDLRDQSFEDAYQVHDVGTAMVRDRCLDFGLQAFNHGDDKREIEDVYSGTGVDLGIEYRPNEHAEGTTVGWTEVKTKQNADWLGRLNKHDWEEYRGFATYVDEDVFLYFCLVEDVDSGTVGHRYFVRVPPMTEDDIAVELPFESKGHRLVSVKEEDIEKYGDDLPLVDEVGWPTVVGSFMSQLHDE